MESDQEIRLRCIEAVARNPLPHPQGYSAGVLEAAQKFADWVFGVRPIVPEDLK